MIFPPNPETVAWVAVAVLATATGLRLVRGGRWVAGRAAFAAAAVPAAGLLFVTIRRWQFERSGDPTRVLGWERFATPSERAAEFCTHLAPFVALALLAVAALADRDEPPDHRTPPGGGPDA